MAISGMFISLHKSADTWNWHWQFLPYDQSYLDAFFISTLNRKQPTLPLRQFKPPPSREAIRPTILWTRPYKGRYWAYSKEKMDNSKPKGDYIFR